MVATITFYAVVWIHLRHADPLYLGNNLEHAAEAIQPGTCHGSGTTEHEALMAAKAARMKIQGILK